MAATLTAAQLATAKQLIGFLSPPLPMNSAIAVCGNVGQECAFNPTLLGDGGVSRYWMQWQGTRLTAYETWCTNNKVGVTDPKAIQFFNYELPTADGAPLIVPWLMDTSAGGEPSRSLATLTADICQYYERAGVPDLDSRINYANQVAVFLNANPNPVVPAVPTPTSTPVPVAAPVPAATPSLAVIQAQVTDAIVILQSVLTYLKGTVL